MAANFPGEFEIRMNYTVLLGGITSNHQMRHSFDANTVGVVGDDFTAWFPVQRGGSEAADLNVLFNNWSLFVQAYYHTTFDMIDVELWKYTPLTFDAAWQSVKAAALVGTGSIANVQDSEQILSFRTTAGGVMRTHFMQGPTLPGLKQLLPLANADLDQLADAILASGNWFKARDGGYPITFLGMYPGENEALFKQRFR